MNVMPLSIAMPASVKDDARKLADWLTRCELAHPKSIDMGLERVLAVKQRMGLRFAAPVITVAGTNGKGSTCAMLERLALESGLRVGLYSKPHLVHFEERCRLSGRMVTPGELLPHFAAVEAARGTTTLTYFEHTTLAILRLLSHEPLDLVILEVGLGGRLDAVNVIDADCAVITSIGIDHVEYLGATREAIGREKAGIFRPRMPAVIGDCAPPASLDEHAKAIGARPCRAGREFRVQQRTAAHWSWQGLQHRLESLPYPHLTGECQLHNAATALAAWEALAPRLPFPAPQVVARALQQVRLPGRFEILPGRPRVILDVAHNLASVEALVERLHALPNVGRTLAVFGCMHDKAIGALLTEMMPQVDRWYLTDLPIARAATAQALYKQALPLSGPHRVSCHPAPAAALANARAFARPDDVILVFGSFHTVAGVLPALSR